MTNPETNLAVAAVQHDSVTSDASVIRGQRKALELALHGAPLSEILDVLVRTVESQSSQHVIGSILLLDIDAGRLRHGAGPNLPAEYNAAIDGIEIGPTVGSCGTAAFTGKPVVVTDIQTDPLWSAFKDLAGKFDLRACWSMPFFSSDGSVLGTFALYHRSVTSPAQRDREVVDLLAHTAAIVVERDLHARRRSEAEARLSRERETQLRQISALFEHAPAAIAVMRGDAHVIESANHRYLEIVGGRNVIKQNVRDAFPEIKGQGFFELLDGVSRTGEPYIGRAQRVMLRREPSGELEERYFDFVYQPVPSSDPAERAILTVAFEVTDLMRSKIEADDARQRAEASEHALATFIDNLPELAWTARPDGHIDYYNRRWYEYTGTTFEEMQGWGWEKVHDPKLLPNVVERWKHSLATGEPFEMEFTLRGADGIPRWFLTRVAPTRDASGKIVRWFGTNTNIDDIKASQALAEAMAEQSRETQRALLDMRRAREAAEEELAQLQRVRGGRP